MATAATTGGHGAFLEGMSARFRDRRNVDLRAFISRARRQRPGPFRIVDLGGSLAYWERVGLDFLEAEDCTVVCVNRSDGELKAEAARSPRLSAAIGDACAMDAPDDSFDLVHSNSVVEHVGGFAQMEAFAREVRRLAPAYYVQTPYFWFPVDPHFPRLPFYHWLPVSMQTKLQQRMKLGWAGKATSVAHAMRHVEGTVLLDRERFRHLFPDATHRFERLALLPKSMIAERPSRG